MKKCEKLLFGVGLVMVCLVLLPWVILGERAVITYHDQLDGEMIAYVLQAKHLGLKDTLPEFMNGAFKTALTPPAPASVLLFLSGHYEAALFVMQLLGSLVGYVGMFLLAREVTGYSLVAVVAGGLYGVLPFLPVYGFSQYGLPLLVWCVLMLRRGRYKIGCLGYGLLFALNSSLALVGFAVLAVLGVWILWDWFGRKRQESKRVLGLWLTVFVGYLATNLSLLGQVLGMGEQFVSHKTEYVLAAENFGKSWLNGLLYGGQHSQDYHLSFLIVGSLVVLLALWTTKETATRRLAYIALTLAGCNVIFAAVAAFWNSAAGIAIRGQLGALGAFQVDRFLWLSPCLWYLFLACSIALLGMLWREKNAGIGRWGAAAGAVLMVAALGISGLQILKNSDFKANIQKLRNPDYPAMSYEDYYAIGVYDQVAEFMAEYTGKSPSEYRVVSLGIDPAAALYHGFYCLDGYSNHYSLEYKHAFRKVIAPALQESEYLREYFDQWGNRCYLFGSECPGYYTIEKNGFYFNHLELDTQALKDLGGDFIFSAAYIANAKELGLRQLCEEPFETEGSYYRIFVYEVE